jgi:cold shock CspA family protein
MNATTTRFTGTLKKWNVDRGFGFVVAEHSDQELFVHVSAFPRDGRQPIVGEPLTFEMELAADGRKRAVRVRRPRDATKSTHLQDRSTDAQRRRHSARTGSASSSSFGSRLIAVLLLAALGWFGYGQYREYIAARSLAPEAPQGVMASPVPSVAPPPRAPVFQCDGRQHCSQMTSCREAKLFLKNCPGMQMDGDGDGTPCEQQWCTGLFGG